MLREQILTDLSGIDDLWMACQAGDFERAERLAAEFSDELRLMQDLGWDSAPPEKDIKLTMPVEDLLRLFTRLRLAVEEMRADEEHEEAEAESAARAFQERTRRISEVCERVLCVAAGTSSAHPLGEDGAAIQARLGGDQP